MFGDVTVTSRPLRLAFLIRPTKEDLEAAVRLNCSLWGGAFNPIIPLYSRVPKTWDVLPSENSALQKRVLGYLNTFDPDILINMTGAGVPKYIDTTTRIVGKPEEFWAEFPGDDRPKRGVGIFELYHGLYKKFFEHTRRHPVRVSIPTFPDQHHLFWLSLVGGLPANIEAAVIKAFSGSIDIDTPPLDPADYSAVATPGTLTPRHVTRFEVKQTRSNRFGNDSCALYFDAGHLGDLIDLWNLRALGRVVLALPKQYALEPANLTYAREFIDEQSWVDKRNPGFVHGVSIIRGQSATMEELQAYTEALDLQNHLPAEKQRGVIGLQHWFPRIWDEWAVSMDSASPDRLSSKSTEYEFRDTEGDVSFKTVKPDFKVRDMPNGPRYANDIAFKFYGENEKILAGLLPFDHGKQVVRAAGGIFAYGNDFRIGRSGLVHLSGWKSNIRLNVPLGEDILYAWLRDKGYAPELSTCGFLAKQLNAHLKGWTGVLTNEPLLKLLEHMNGDSDDGRGAEIGHVKAELKKIGPHLYKELSERGVFQLGFKTQCPECRRRSWYGLKEMAPSLTCPLCHQAIPALAAVDADNKGRWHLKTSGPFSVPNYVDGAYSVLLTHGIFDRHSNIQATPAFGFKAKPKTAGKSEIEADYAMLWREAHSGDLDEGVLFAECKSYNLFEKKDFARMKMLAEEFPGAVLAFCTLRRELTAAEKKAISAIAKRGRKYWKPERPINPVLILTGNELFNHVKPPHCWKDMTVPDWTSRSYSLLDWCNSTQAIYLGLPHWGKDFEQQFEARNARRAARAKSTVEK